jgi:K+ transporter
MAEKQDHGLHKLSAAGVLISLGIIFGDIGTSPIYVLRAIMTMAMEGNHAISERFSFRWFILYFLDVNVCYNIKICNTGAKCR